MNTFLLASHFFQLSIKRKENVCSDSQNVRIVFSVRFFPHHLFCKEELRYGHNFLTQIFPFSTSPDWIFFLFLLILLLLLFFPCLASGTCCTVTWKHLPRKFLAWSFRVSIRNLGRALVWFAVVMFPPYWTNFPDLCWTSLQIHTINHSSKLLFLPLLS